MPRTLPMYDAQRGMAMLLVITHIFCGWYTSLLGVKHDTRSPKDFNNKAQGALRDPGLCCATASPYSISGSFLPNALKDVGKDKALLPSRDPL